MEHITAEEFDLKILSNGEKKLVIFYADWCPYCTNFKPTFEEINSDKIEKKASLVNEDDNPLWERFDIQSVPTIIAFQNGKIIARRDSKEGIGLTRSDMEAIVRDLNS